MKLLPLLFFAGLALGLLSGCAAYAQRRAASRHPMLAPYQTEKFRLSAGPATADNYPVTIDRGRFINSGGTGFPVPYGHFLESSWEGSGIGWAVGDDFQAVPDSLEIRWFSYTEDKFYEGHFLLPQEKIYALLKQGFWEPKSKRALTYDGFTVCVLPTGGVVVWLEGHGLRKVVVGRYQAQEIQYDYARHRPNVDRAADVAETRAELPAAVQAEIKAGTLSTKKWDAYLKRYPWKLEFSQPLTLFDHGISFRSAENASTPLTADLAAFAQEVLAPSPKPVPKSCMLYLAGAYGRKRLLKIKPFDEAETMHAFQTLAAKHPDQVITLHVEIDEELKKATLSLRAGGQVLPLTKSVLQFFDLRQ